MYCLYMYSFKFGAANSVRTCEGKAYWIAPSLFKTAKLYLGAMMLLEDNQSTDSTGGSIFSECRLGEWS